MARAHGGGGGGGGGAGGRDDGRAGTPLLQGHVARSDVDRPSAGHRTPRRLSGEGVIGVGEGTPGRPAPAAGPRRPRTLRSRSPASRARRAARTKYAYASVFLVLSLVSFTVQTELAAWVQRAGWDKAYCMLYLTHGSWALLWPAQLLVLRLRQRAVPWPVFWRRHVWLVRTTAAMVATREVVGHTGLPQHGRAARGEASSWRARFLAWARDPTLAYMARTTAGVTCALTVAGLSWYVAVSMTSPSDLTAIYNCSAFFAYAFSVPLLKERLRLDKSLAVLVAVLGVLVVAYGDAGGSEGEDEEDGRASGTRRLLGNLIIGAGSVLYGLYEVLYKRYACPPDGCSAGRGMVFANTFGSAVGVFTLAVLWVPLPLLHVLGVERFALPPSGRVAGYLLLSVLMNATFAGSFLVLISLTSPVLSSVASLLTIFIVAVADWRLTGTPPSAAALLGGGMIVAAFALLSWSTYQELAEDALKTEADGSGSGSDDGDGEGDDSEDSE